MPLRDHFRPPLSDLTTWEGFHGMWPATIVLSLADVLPVGYTAEPRVHHGAHVEIDVSTYQLGDMVTPVAPEAGGVATAVWAPPAPTVVLATDLPDQDEYEVRVYDTSPGRRLVAAVEIVSPANKDRPAHRRAFVTKCAALLRSRVAVTIIDLITPRHFNLYRDLLDWLGHAPPGGGPSTIYASVCRTVEGDPGWRLEAWERPLVVGEPLPTLPLWLADDLAIPLDLSASYEHTCRALRFP